MVVLIELNTRQYRKREVGERADGGQWEGRGVMIELSSRFCQGRVDLINYVCVF